jgi:hypothetical protein
LELPENILRLHENVLELLENIFRLRENVLGLLENVGAWFADAGGQGRDGAVVAYAITFTVIFYSRGLYAARVWGWRAIVLLMWRAYNLCRVG